MGTLPATLLAATALVLAGQRSDVGNRLTYLDEFCDPYYAGLETAKLVTPQWIGEPGIDAAIVLAVDDMSAPDRYEAFLRPIFERLKRIDGRAPVSIMTKTVDPGHPLLPKWFEEGVSLQTHTVDHPCPCLQGPSESGLAAAKDTFDRCVDQLATLYGEQTSAGAGPVAFRMPCCDSMNSVSPRFFTEIFNKTTPAGHFLTIDSSVFQLFTADDPALPRELVFEEDGAERFRKYVPTDRVMVNYVENYPFPFVIGRLCWEFPCLMPSDWDAQHLNGKCSPATLRDLKAAVDAVVIKQGVFSLCFHPHGWIAAEQVVELVDYADRTYGPRVKFLTFNEVQERLDRNLLGGQPLRAADGGDNGVRVLDLDNDGYMDVVIGNQRARQTRLWRPSESRWQIGDFPTTIVEGNGQRAGERFAVFQKDGGASLLSIFGQERTDHASRVWHFDGTEWITDPHGAGGLMISVPRLSADGGIRARDLDGDGTCELIVGNSIQREILAWSAKRRRWQLLPFALPEGTAIVDSNGRDAGLRLVDVDEDGFADVVFSDAERYSLHLFTSMSEGWSRCVRSGRRGDKDEVPPIVRGDGSNNGAWFSCRHMWVQNEDTGKVLPDHVLSRPFNALLSAEP